MNEWMHACIPKSWLWLPGNVWTDKMYALNAMQVDLDKEKKKKKKKWSKLVSKKKKKKQ